jgi:signal transduction histidine kinase
VQEAGDRGLIVSIARDVTERENVARLKNEFVSTVSHELRTPLTSIRGSLGLLLGGASGDLTPDMRNLVAIAHRNCERLINIVNDILDIEKIKAGKLRAKLRPEDLVQLVQQAIDSNGAYAAQHGVSFHLIGHIDRAMVNLDHERFMQIMANLLSNAAKFSPRDGKVDIAIERCLDKYRVRVSDKGPGIPLTFRKDLFKPFSQADASNTRQKGGTGLGLAITKSLVEQMGGEIGFVTAADVGTTFYVEWPALDAVTASS